MEEKKAMQLAIDKAREGIKNGNVVACEHNVVWKTTDITAHAEINAIRVACKNLNSIDLSGCTIFSTCEPCPMCFSACHWARIAKIVYGASIADAKIAGFHELSISNETMKELGSSEVEIVFGFMREENVQLFEEWKQKCGSKVY